jgi:L-ribulokinase
MKKYYVIGIDYGTDSVRTVIADTSSGEELCSSVFYYPRWKNKKYCDPPSQQYRQHPLDYIEGLEQSVKDCISKVSGEVVDHIRGISVDTTGSTPVAVNQQGTPLALLPEFKENPNAMFVLWKDHTAIKEAEEINFYSQQSGSGYLNYVGSIYSSEWYWAKLLHILRVDEKVRSACYTFVEHCDWIPFLLTGQSTASQLKRSRCAAGHKALWAEEFNGYPPNEFFTAIDPLLDGYSTLLPRETYTSDHAAGKLSLEWAKRLGLNEDVLVGVGGFDAHMGAVGGQIEPYHLSKVIGTSTCDILVVPEKDIKQKLVKGICGQVHGSVIPGMIGLEAGQSAFGDYYAWFNTFLSWPLQIVSPGQHNAIDLLPELTRRAAALPPDDNDIIATDWINGRRTPDADQSLKATITGLDLSSDPVKIFRAIVESTCFGARAITDRFNEQGVPIKGLIGLGGIASRSPFIMQMLADVINLPIRVHKSEQTCALGAAMFAATAAGIYKTVEEAMHAMGQGFSVTYYPDAKRNRIYDQKYKRYLALGKITLPVVENHVREAHFQ